MAKRDDTRNIPPPTNQTYQERRVTVSLYPEYRPHVPWIRLKGLWLEEAGFSPESKLRIRVMTNCLVITKD
jgi:hypothetical protein